MVLPAVALIAAASPALAQEPVALETLDDARLELLPLRAAEDGVHARLGGGLELNGVSTGPRPDYLAAGELAAELGFHGDSWHYGYGSLRPTAWWSPARGTPDLAFRGAAGAYVNLLPAHDAAVDLETKARIDYSSQADLGGRRIDVGPAPFTDAAVAATLRLIGGNGIERRRSEQLMVGLGYHLRDTRYEWGGPSLQSHGVQLGLGQSEHKHDTHFHVNFLRGRYAHQTVTHDTGQLLTYMMPVARPQHRFDFEFFDLDMRMFEKDDWAATFDLGIGWSFLWWGPNRDDPNHTPAVTLGASVGDDDFTLGFTTRHRLAQNPRASRALGLTELELMMKVNPRDLHFGFDILGKVTRVNDLVNDEVEDAWLAQFSSELYGSIEGAEMGLDGAVSHGQPTGSMGFDPFLQPAMWSARAGVFLRGRADL